MNEKFSDAHWLGRVHKALDDDKDPPDVRRAWRDTRERLGRIAGAYPGEPLSDDAIRALERLPGGEAE